MSYQIDYKDLHIFQQLLIGTWSNDGVPTDPKNNLPFSYNVMPLPQKAPEPLYTSGPHRGFILKNFRYREEITFHPPARTYPPGTPLPPTPVPPPPTIAPAVGAPNRGDSLRQVPHALFYDQVVRFAEGPQGPTGPLRKDTRGDIVHAENGAWLHLQHQKLQNGPYPTRSHPATIPPTDITYAKQISVPHGNSVLALGTYDGSVKLGAPDLGATSGLPTEIDVTRFHTILASLQDFENPDKDYTENPLKPLTTLVANHLKVTHFHHVFFSTHFNLKAQRGQVTNIPFEERLASALDYQAEYWLLEVDNSSTFDYLAYVQIMTLELNINGISFKFPHVTTNVVKRQTPAIVPTGPSQHDT